MSDRNMLENLLQKVEEKTMLLSSQLEEARKEVDRLASENTILKSEREKHEKKLQDLLSLLDTVNEMETPVNTNANLAAVKPVLVQA